MKTKNTILSLFMILMFSFTLVAQTRIWNIKTLKTARNKSNQASVKLIADADKLLNKTLVTVMDKGLTPSSGNKHDYMSAGRYWWPDPTKPGGLPYIRKDGIVNREIDNLDRMPLAALAKSIITLATAYFLSSDEKYAAKAVDNLRIWFIDEATKMNPNLNYGQTIPGHNDGFGRGEGVIDTYSFVDMMDALELLKQSSQFTTKDQKALTDWFTSYLGWMLSSKIAKEVSDAKNNHGTAFDVQVVRFALYLGKEELAKEYLSAFPSRRLFAQIEPDGAQPLELERTTALGYSIFNLWHILDMSAMAKSMNIDLYNSTSTDQRSITKAIDFLSPYLGKTQADFPYKQIKEWDEQQEKLAWVLYRADNLSPNQGYQKLYENYIHSSSKSFHVLIY